MKDNRRLREKIMQSIKLLFSLDLYREILEDNEQQEEEIAQAVNQKLAEMTQAAQDVLRQNAPCQAHCET